MKSDKEELSRLILGMRAAFMRGDNAMAWARDNSSLADNTLIGTLIAYDLQAGTYVDAVRNDLSYSKLWCDQIAGLLNPYIAKGDCILEVGVGEATTLTGVIKALNCKDVSPFGFDISWSRVTVGQKWTAENLVSPRLFVGDLFHIPLADNSMDVIYTSHSLEPNGGKEEAAVKELLRVARKAVVLVEPCYELASKNAQKRMRDHGYVRGLKAVAELLDANVIDHRLLDIFSNPLNPSGVTIILKPRSSSEGDSVHARGRWQCPLTGTLLTDKGDFFYASSVGIAYPVLQGVPLLRPEHAVVASRLSDS